MANIKIIGATIDIPVYSSHHRSLKSSLLQVATGGRIFNNSNSLTHIRALDNISINIESGERVGVIGHNGAGKSSLLRLLSGIYVPTSGSAEISGQTGSLVDISLGLDPEYSGLENIYLRGGLLGIKKKTLSALIPTIIDFSGLGEFINLPLRTYSTGMQLRLAFAISTSINPEILVMDEWLSVGDESFRIKAESRLGDLLEDTKILVIASHSRQMLTNICTRIIWLEHGAVRMDDKPLRVLGKYFKD